MRTLTVRSALAVGVLAVALISCSEEQRRDIEGATVSAELKADTESALDSRNIDLDGELDCSADIADDGRVTGTCDGTDDDGNAVSSSIEGTVDVDEAECESVLTVTVAGDVVLEDTDHDCLD